MMAAIPGLIIAGGTSRRMGTSKPFVPFRGEWLIDAVAVRVSCQVDPLILNLKADDEERYRRQRSKCPPFARDDGLAGPLGGIVAGLDLVAGASECLATFPGDTPFLPLDLVARLRFAAGAEKPAVAVAGDRIQSLCAVWPTSCRDRLRRGFVEEGWKSVWRALEALGAAHVAFADADAFFNINTPAELERAEIIASSV